jgi:DNA-binding NarL/FixJ family response regulator
MPIMDGYTATTEIRALEQAQVGGLRTPIVALTAHALKTDREHCLAVGMDDYMTKPVVLDDIRGVLNKYAEPHRRARALISRDKVSRHSTLTNLVGLAAGKLSPEPIEIVSSGSASAGALQSNLADLTGIHGADDDQQSSRAPLLAVSNGESSI